MFSPPGVMLVAGRRQPCLPNPIGSVDVLQVTALWQFFLIRMLTGIAVGGCFPLVFSLLGDLFPISQRSAMAALVQIAVGAGIGGGQVQHGLLRMQPGANDSHHCCVLHHAQSQCPPGSFQLFKPCFTLVDYLTCVLPCSCWPVLWGQQPTGRSLLW